MVDILSKRPKKFTQVKTNSSNYTNTIGTNSYALYNSLSSGSAWTNSYCEVDSSIPIDVNSDMNEEVSFEKGKETITLKRKLLYELILMVEEDGETIDTISMNRFKELLTAVKL